MSTPTTTHRANLNIVTVTGNMNITPSDGCTKRRNERVSGGGGREERDERAQRVRLLNCVGLCVDAVHPTPAPPKSVEPAQQQPAASPETEFKLRSALDRIVARVRSIFQSERDQVQQAAKELNDVNEKLNAELADKAKAMQHEAEAAKDRASVSGSTAAKIEPTPAKSEPAKTVPRPMHVLLKPEVNPPIAVALSVTDIISQCAPGLA